MRAVWTALTILAGLGADVALNTAFSSEPRKPQLKAASHLRVQSVGEDNLSVYFTADKQERTEFGEVLLSGDAQIRRLDAVAKGDEIHYQQDTGDLKIRGKGSLIREGSIIRSEAIDYNMNSETGQVQDPTFMFGGAGGSGSASEVQMLSRDHLRMKTVEYTGCPCPAPSWFIRAPQVDLYNDKNAGVAKHGVLYFKNVPILYSPYLTFPLREERKSGLLVPAYGYSSNSGLEFSVPYYFNLAPNYDATLTPRYMSKRGLQMQGEFRYLNENYHGQLQGTYLNKDKKTKTDRWSFGAEHQHYIGGGVGFAYNYRRVSDDNFFRDLSTFGVNQASVTELASDARFTWSGAKYFNAALSVTKYQTLQDSETYYRRPEYDRLPQFELHGVRHNWNGFDVASHNYATRFVMPYYSGNLHAFDQYRNTRLAPNSTRVSSYTTVAYPIIRPAWYVTPKFGLHLSHYDTDWKSVSQVALRNLKSNVSRAVPFYSLDAGMTFERDTSLFGIDSIQTLEPRIYYLYVPYRDQNDIPNLDTSVASFNFAQAFSENIYSGGWDRIANANQLTIGLTTRWLDADTGFERVSLQAAQRLHFEDQQVFLRTYAPHEHPPGRTRSDYLFGAQAALTDNFTVRLDAQLNPETTDRNRMSARVRWSPKRLATIAASYRYERDPRAFDNPHYQFSKEDGERTKEQLSLTTQWPLTNRVYALGRVDYSLQEKRSTQTILGFEYKGDCCWTGRFVVQRYAVSAQKSNSAVFLQLELSGLGSLGTDPMSLLRERIVGYESVSPSIPEKTTFERYE